jgi:hypothetical protein
MAFPVTGWLRAGALFVLLIPQIAGAQTFNLSGSWRDDNGVVIPIRQVDERICWYANAMPRVQNVFCGLIAGDTITGEWMDLPGGQLQNAGQLAIHIESNNRLVKIGSSSPFAGSVWTRVTDYGTPTTQNGGGANTFKGGMMAGHRLTLTVIDGNRREWIRATRTCNGPDAACDAGREAFKDAIIDRSPGLERLGSASGSFKVGHSANLNFTATLDDGTVPPGHYLKIYWQGYPQDRDPACRAEASASTCSFSGQMPPNGNPYFPIICAAVGANQGVAQLMSNLATVCISTQANN